MLRQFLDVRTKLKPIIEDPTTFPVRSMTRSPKVDDLAAAAAGIEEEVPSPKAAPFKVSR